MCGALSFALRRSVLKSESSFPSFVSRSSAQKPARYSSHERVFSDCCIYSTHCWSFVRQYRVSARCVRSRAMYSTTAPTNYCAYSLTLFSFKVFHLSRFFFWKSIRLRHVFANRMYSALMISRWKYFTQTHLDTYYSYTTNTKRQYPLLCGFVCESVCDYVDVAVVLVVIIIFVIPVFWDSRNRLTNGWEMERTKVLLSYTPCISLPPSVYLSHSRCDIELCCARLIPKIHTVVTEQNKTHIL